MSREHLSRGLLFVLITLLRPLGYILRSGYETDKGPKYFVYDID